MKWTDKVEGLTDGWADGWINMWSDGQIYRFMGVGWMRWMGRLVVGCIDLWMNEEMDLRMGLTGGCMQWMDGPICGWMDRLIDLWIVG